MEESLPIPIMSDTLLQQLSSTIQSMLSTFQQLPALTALEALANLPKHPYERLKYDLYGPEYKDVTFKTLDDVPVPEDFCYNASLQNVVQRNKYINDTLMHNLTCEPNLRADTTMFTLSGDKIIPKIDKQMKQVEFIEMIAQLPVSTLNNNQLLECSKKIISEYLKIHD